MSVFCGGYGLQRWPMPRPCSYRPSTKPPRTHRMTWHTRARRYAEGISGMCFIAERGGQSIGMVFGFVDGERSFVARVGAMWVAPTARRAGAGAKLLRTVREWATERRCSELRLHVFHAGSDAHSFYRSQGLQILSPQPDKDGFVEYGERLHVAYPALAADGAARRR